MRAGQQHGPQGAVRRPREDARRTAVEPGGTGRWSALVSRAGATAGRRRDGVQRSAGSPPCARDRDRPHRDQGRPHARAVQWTPLSDRYRHAAFLRAGRPGIGARDRRRHVHGNLRRSPRRAQRTRQSPAVGPAALEKARRVPPPGVSASHGRAGRPRGM